MAGDILLALTKNQLAKVEQVQVPYRRVYGPSGPRTYVIMPLQYQEKLRNLFGFQIIPLRGSSPVESMELFEVVEESAFISNAKRKQIAKTLGAIRNPCFGGQHGIKSEVKRVLLSAFQYLIDRESGNIDFVFHSDLRPIRPRKSSVLQICFNAMPTLSDEAKIPVANNSLFEVSLNSQFRLFPSTPGVTHFQMGDYVIGQLIENTLYFLFDPYQAANPLLLIQRAGNFVTDVLRREDLEIPPLSHKFYLGSKTTKQLVRSSLRGMHSYFQRSVENFRQAEEELNRTQTGMLKARIKYDRAKSEMNLAQSAQNALTQRAAAVFERCLEIPGVSELYARNDGFSVFTDPLIAVHPRTRRKHLLGMFEIRFRLSLPVDKIVHIRNRSAVVISPERNLMISPTIDKNGWLQFSRFPMERLALNLGAQEIDRSLELVLAEIKTVRLGDETAEKILTLFPEVSQC